MSLIRINHDPSRRQLAVFGVAWLVFFSILGSVVLAKAESTPIAATLWAVAVGVPAVGYIAPEFLRIVYVGMCYVAAPIGWVISHIVLALVYYLLMTPIGWLMRLFRYDPLRRRFDRSAATYWIPREEDENTQHYFRQF